MDSSDIPGVDSYAVEMGLLAVGVNNNKLSVMRARRKADGQLVNLLVITAAGPEGFEIVHPLAEMFSVSPSDTYETPDGAGGYSTPLTSRGPGSIFEGPVGEFP